MNTRKTFPSNPLQAAAVIACVWVALAVMTTLFLGCGVADVVTRGW